MLREVVMLIRWLACMLVPPRGRGSGSAGPFRGSQNGLNQLPAVILNLNASGCVLLQREVPAPVDPGLLRLRELRERIPTPDHEVGILARLERSHAVVD